MWFKALSTPTGVKSIVLHLHQHPYCFLPSFRILFLWKAFSLEKYRERRRKRVRILVELRGCDSKAWQHQRGAKALLPISTSTLTVSFLPSVCFSYEKLFIRKAYGRKEGNSKDTTGGGGMWFKVLCKHLAHHFHQHLYCFLFSFCTLFTQYVNRMEGRKKTVKILV